MSPENLPNVERVHDATGSHIEPPLDLAWSRLEQLRWHAAVACHDTGIAFDVREMSDGTFGIVARGLGVGGSEFHAVWNYINGMSLGARLVRARVEAVDDKVCDALTALRNGGRYDGLPADWHLEQALVALRAALDAPTSEEHP